MDKVKIAAIAGIVIIEAIALFNGINGTLMATSLAIVAGLGGYQFGKNRRG